MNKKDDTVELELNHKVAKLQKTILELGKMEQDLLKDVDWSILLNPENRIYFKAEEIAEMLGKGWNSTKVNDILKEMKYQFYFKKDYLPTKIGVESGCAHRIIFLDFRENSTAFAFSLVWTINIVDRIKEYQSQKQKNNEEENNNESK